MSFVYRYADFPASFLWFGQRCIQDGKRSDQERMHLSCDSGCWCDLYRFLRSQREIDGDQDILSFLAHDLNRFLLFKKKKRNEPRVFSPRRLLSMRKFSNLSRMEGGDL